ncbi:unnamed protein product, partial [Prorocentrum cordatum]
MKDLIARLEADALPEASHEEFCDEGVSKAVGERDEGVGESGTINKDMTIKTAEASQLPVEIATLSTQIAENKKGLPEATELRAAGFHAHFGTFCEAEAGLAALKEAAADGQAWRDRAAFWPEGGRAPARVNHFGSHGQDRGRLRARRVRCGPSRVAGGLKGHHRHTAGDRGRLRARHLGRRGSGVPGHGLVPHFQTENEADMAAKDTEKT